jgi:hypothetical protein
MAALNQPRGRRMTDIVAVILLFLMCVAFLRFLSKHEERSARMDSRLEAIESEIKRLQSMDDNLEYITQSVRTYMKYNTFPLGDLGRPLIGSESEYDR